jgi:hypothetical protein
MGLDTTFDCWHGPYSSFNRFRRTICKAAGMGDLDSYKGFGGDKEWPENEPITILLDHSDCDGEITAKDCAPLADAMEELLPELDDSDPCLSDAKQAKQFIKGLRKAAKAKKPVEFR